jgi:hypothetical protein
VGAKRSSFLGAFYPALRNTSGLPAAGEHVADELNLGLLQHHALGHGPGEDLLVEDGVALDADEHDHPALLHLGEAEARDDLEGLGVGATFFDWLF